MHYLLKTGILMASFFLSGCSSTQDPVVIQPSPEISTTAPETTEIAPETTEIAPEMTVTPSETTGNTSTTDEFISELEAKEIALLHANVNEADATFVKVKFDYDDRIPEFEVEFYVGNTEYDYEIHATTGEILSFDQEIETPRTPTTSGSNTATGDVISEVEAKEIALNHAGLNESDVSRLKVEFDYDDGIPEYEVEFYVGNVEYDYEIHGITGEILSFGRD